MRALAAAWRYRGFVLGSVRRDYHQRYRSSVFGAVWTVLQPLATIVIYALVFSQLMRIRLSGMDDTFSYSVYICTGIIVWNLFATISTRCQSVFVDNGEMLKKLSFPRVCLPLSVVISALIDFAIIFTIFMLFLFIIGRMPGLEILAILPLLALLIVFASAIGMALGVLNVFFRDISQAFSIVLQFWFWLTPIVYPVDILPERFARLIEWNPMTHLLQAFQGIFVFARAPDWSQLVYTALVAGLFSLLAVRIYRRWAADMVDEL